MHRIRRISPIQAGKVAAVLYGLVGALMVPVLLIVLLAVPDQPGMQFGIIGVFAMLALYAVVGAVGTMIAAMIYNLVAGWVGGIEIDVD